MTPYTYFSCSVAIIYFADTVEGPRRPLYLPPPCLQFIFSEDLITNTPCVNFFKLYIRTIYNTAAVFPLIY